MLKILLMLNLYPNHSFRQVSGSLPYGPIYQNYVKKRPGKDYCSIYLLYFCK